MKLGSSEKDIFEKLLNKLKENSANLKKAQTKFEQESIIKKLQ